MTTNDIPYVPNKISDAEYEAHLIGAIGHYASVAARLESELNEAKHTQSMFRLKLKEFKTRRRQ